MNVQPTLQNRRSSTPPLYTIKEQEERFKAFDQHQANSFAEKAPGSGTVKVYTTTGPNLNFVERITSLIEENMDDETYGIDQLCQDAGASRSQLHTKLKKWTGLSTSHFIRSIKLRRAKYLLVQTDLNITQVAFEIGFHDPCYLTRVFSDSFGISPKNFRKRWQQPNWIA